MSEIKQRNISLDCLKILSMIMVIILHTKTYGLSGVNLEPSDELYWIVNALHTFSLVAVNCFVLISGYFVNTSTPSPKKLFRLWLQVEILSVGTYILACIVPNNKLDFGLGQLFVQMLPIMSNRYWFFNCYFVLMVIAPFLNRFINTLEQKEFKKCLLILLVLFMLIPSINPFGDVFDSASGYSTAWFIILYLVAAYIRRYPLPKKPYGILYFAVSAFSILAYAALDYLSKYLNLFGDTRDILYRYNSMTVFIASVCLFLFFIHHPLTTEKSYGKFITKLSATCFCVYLFHESPVLRTYLWNDVFRLHETVNDTPSYLLRLFIAISVIFIIGITSGFVLSFMLNTGEKLIHKIKKK